MNESRVVEAKVLHPPTCVHGYSHDAALVCAATYPVAIADGLDEAQAEVAAWHTARFGPDVPAWRVYLKLVSEVGELGDALLLETAAGVPTSGKGSVAEELGDVQIALLVLAERVDRAISECYVDKFTDVRARREVPS